MHLQKFRVFAEQSLDYYTLKRTKKGLIYLLLYVYLHWKAVLWIRNDLFRIQIQVRIRIQIQVRIRIRIQPILFKHNWKYKKTLNSPKRRTYQLSAIFYCIVLPKIKNKIFLNLFAGAGSGTIIQDPDPGKSSGSATLLKSMLLL